MLGGFSPPAAGSSPTVCGCKAPHEEPRLGQPQKISIKGEGLATHCNEMRLTDGRMEANLPMAQKM